MNTAENCSLDFISQMHTCCWWQMALLQGKNELLRIIKSFVECRCFVLSGPRQLSVSFSAAAYHYFLQRLQIFIMTVSTDGGEKKGGERRERRERMESASVCFSHHSHGWQQLLATVWVKKVPGAEVEHVSVS